MNVGKRSTYGFTIVELLVAIVVIGILSGATVVAFDGVKKRGTESLLTADVRANLLRVKQYTAANDSYPESAVPLSTEESKRNDWHIKGSKRSLYDTFTYCAMAKNWGHPIEGIVFYIKISDGRSYVANTDNDQVKEVTDQVTSGSDPCVLGVRPGYVLVGGDGLVYPSGATQRIIFTAP